MGPAIRTHGLSKRYGSTEALVSLDIEVPRGVVFGYLGPNGAGKTTTIRLLLGHLRPTHGEAQVLGLDVGAEREEIHRRVGYLPGDFVAYGDLTGAQYLEYLSNLRSGDGWDAVPGLAERLELDLERRIGALSHGNKQKVGLIQAFMHRPELLVLDEPTAGLDPLVQQEFRKMVAEVRDEGRTVFLSSHILDEVEHVADSVAILRKGSLVVVEQVSALKAKALRRLVLTFAGEPPVDALSAAASVEEISATDHEVQLVVSGTVEELMKIAAPHGIESVVSHEADLEEIFLKYYSGDD